MASERWFYGKDGNVHLKSGKVLGQWHDGKKVLVPVTEKGRQWLMANKFELEMKETEDNGRL